MNGRNERRGEKGRGEKGRGEKGRGEERQGETRAPRLQRKQRLALTVVMGHSLAQLGPAACVGEEDRVEVGWNGSGNEGGGETEGVVKVDLVRRKMMTTMKTKKTKGGLWTRRAEKKVERHR